MSKEAEILGRALGVLKMMQIKGIMYLRCVSLTKGDY